MGTSCIKTYKSNFAASVENEVKVEKVIEEMRKRLLNRMYDDGINYSRITDQEIIDIAGLNDSNIEIFKKRFDLKLKYSGIKVITYVDKTIMYSFY